MFDMPYIIVDSLSFVGYTPYRCFVVYPLKCADSNFTGGVMTTQETDDLYAKFKATLNPEQWEMFQEIERQIYLETASAQ